MKNCYQIIIFLLIILISACNNTGSYLKIGSKTTAVTLCKLDCQKRKAMCLSTCNDNCPACDIRSTRSAIKSYKKYIHEECVKGGFIARDLDAYRDPLQCRKVATDCCADFDTCIQSCKGVIKKDLSVAPKCC